MHTGKVSISQYALLNSQIISALTLLIIEYENPETLAKK